MSTYQWRFPRWRVTPARAALALCLAVALAIPSAPASAFVVFRLDQGAPDRYLSAADIERYRTIFAAQDDGDWKAADDVIAQLDNKVLLGHVLAQRYLHPTAYRSSYRELVAWLDLYADHPDARRIYDLAVQRRPKNTNWPRRPVATKDSLGAELPLGFVVLYESGKNLTRAQWRKVQRLKRRVRRYVARTYLSRAEQLLQQPEVRRLFDRFELDDGYAQVAAGWLYHGNAEKAFRLASAVAGRSGGLIPTAHWTAGLAAWRLNRTADAAQHFAQLATSEKASAWNRSAGAYWAARVHQRSSAPAEAYRWYTVAARFPFTFYGLLARHRLNLHLDVTFAAVQPAPPAIDRLLSTAQGARAAALLQIGRKDLAERELLAVPGWKNPATTRAMLALTQSANMPRLGLEMAKRLLSDDRSGWTERDLGGILFPLPRWRPKGGFSVDRALMYAFIRQESSFDPEAKSPAGARGLMQLMPRTASALDRRNTYRGRDRSLLYDPALNLALAQRYMKRLLNSQRVAGDLLRLSVAYNAGPGNLGKWEQRMPGGEDPLLFIESLPSLESRLFVERIMANLWIYRLRLGQPTPTLAALAGDRWPTYEPLDEAPPQIASDY